MHSGVLGAWRVCKAACSQAQKLFEFLDLIFMAFQNHTRLSGVTVSCHFCGGQRSSSPTLPSSATNQKTRKSRLLELLLHTAVLSLSQFLGEFWNGEAVEMGCLHGGGVLKHPLYTQM